MVFNEEIKRTKLLNKTERETIEQLQLQHIKDKNNFKNRIHTMHPEQIKLEYLLLSLEEQAYFKHRKPKEENFDELEEMLFISSQNCCNLKFTSFNEWTQHLHNHPYSAAFVEKKEEEKKVVPKEEVKVVLKSKLFKCEVDDCDKAYTSAYGLRYHMEKGHKDENDSTKPFHCEIDNCKKKYKNSNGLKYHILHSHK